MAYKPKTKNCTKHYNKPYSNLAYAVIRAAEMDNDQAFLKSSWCQLLRDMLILDDEMYGHRGNNDTKKVYL